MSSRSEVALQQRALRSRASSTAPPSRRACLRGGPVAAPLFLSYTWDEPSLAGADALTANYGCVACRFGATACDGRRDYKTETVLDAIERQCVAPPDYTEPILSSEFVCKVELPAMDKRRRRDGSFFSGAAFRFGPITEAAERLRAAAGVEMGEPGQSRR